MRWPWIEFQYRHTDRSVRQIAICAGLSHTAVLKRAHKEGWTRGQPNGGSPVLMPAAVPRAVDRLGDLADKLITAAHSLLADLPDNGKLKTLLASARLARDAVTIIRQTPPAPRPEPEPEEMTDAELAHRISVILELARGRRDAGESAAAEPVRLAHAEVGKEPVLWAGGIRLCSLDAVIAPRHQIRGTPYRPPIPNELPAADTDEEGFQTGFLGPDGFRQ